MDVREKLVMQKVRRNENSICHNCIHHNLCIAENNQPCFECNRFMDAHGVTVQEWISVTESDLIDRKEILDKLDKWMCTVKRNLYPGLMKTTILDTLAHVIEDIQAMKSISQKQSNVSGGANDEAI